MLHGYGVTAVAWLYWNHYVNRYLSSLFNKMKRGTKQGAQGAAQPENTGTSLKRLVDYMRPYTCRFVFVMLLVMLSSYGMYLWKSVSGDLGDVKCMSCKYGKVLEKPLEMTLFFKMSFVLLIFLLLKTS